MNGLPKYVVSSTARQSPNWGNGDGPEAATWWIEVSKLKRTGHDGDIVVYASYQLVRDLLIEHDLVDELRLVVFPVVIGAGERLFGETSDKKALRLLNTRTLGEGLAFVAADHPHGVLGVRRV